MRSQLEGGRARRGVLIDQEGDRLDAPRVARRQGRAHGQRNDRRIFGPRGRIERQQTLAVLDRTALEDVLHKRRPRVGGGFGSKPNPPGDGIDGDRRNGRDAQDPKTGPRHGGCAYRYSHSISANAAVALRALYSSNSAQEPFSDCPAVAAAVAIGAPREIRSRTSLFNRWK